MSLSSFFQNLQSHMNLLAAVPAAISALQQIGHTKESAAAKVIHDIEVIAAVGEGVPVPIVQLVSTTVEEIAQMIFAPSQAAAAASPAPAKPTV